ncbi:polysaccharide biosynthesis C-terminal domain-containing protein [Lysinibacillus sp. MHQ-1]|nr:polysaccharide biosynthesis C-terminal domain-containing protein [Lysinibacillus sp. MHQ-1]
MKCFFKTNALSEVLIVYVFQIVPLSIILTFTAILQGYGKLKKPALFLMIGFVLKNYIKCSFDRLAWCIRSSYCK